MNIEINSERWLSLESLPNEIWKKVNRNPNYEISNYGRVKSLKYNKIKKCDYDKDGYCRVCIPYNSIGVHRLIAEAFLPNPNPNCYTQVNHINEIKSDNRIENLEWCTAKYNMSYGNRTKNIKKQVNQYDLQGNFIKTWDSITLVQETLKIDGSSISKCCKNKIKQAKGFKWKYTTLYK